MPWLIVRVSASTIMSCGLLILAAGRALIAASHTIPVLSAFTLISMLFVLPRAEASHRTVLFLNVFMVPRGSGGRRARGARRSHNWVRATIPVLYRGST